MLNVVQDSRKSWLEPAELYVGSNNVPKIAIIPARCRIVVHDVSRLMLLPTGQETTCK